MTLRRGNILPLAILMVLMILMAGLGIGSVVLEGSKRAAETTRSVSAYYMADSGIERQLYGVRKMFSPVADLATVSSTYPNGGKWAYFANYAQVSQKTIDKLGQSGLSVVDLFDPDTVAPVGIQRAELRWENGDDCGGEQANLEVGYAEWQLQQGSFSETFTIQRGLGGQSMTVLLSPDKAYRLRLRALECQAKNIQVNVYGADGSAKNFPGDIVLAAEGTYGPATQKIAVTMPKLDVLSGLFSFVIFSECTLVKGTDGAQVCP